MTIHNISAYNIRRVIESINRDYSTSMVAEKVVEWKTKQKRLRVRLMLRLEDSGDTFHRRGQTTNRRMRNVCWHGQMLFYKRLFDFNPRAKVRTAVMWYSDVDNFRSRVTTAMTDMVQYCDCADEYDWPADKGDVYDTNAEHVYRELLAPVVVDSDKGEQDHA